MSGEESPKQVNVDPRCIQEALRMYFQPIKSDDPQLDFYTMYKRETMEYDTEYMNKYNEDLNTTLIFAGLFSAVSSAFVIAVQPELQPDPGERSEAYLRAILLSLNPSISPVEYPAAPAWSGPPQEIITTLDLLYASLLMSLLAAFVAMLGKQWLNRYLRHAGGSMIERCGDRQRKFDGLEKWPFRLFIESLPVMLQIALLFLTCGLSRYMWSVNTSVAAVVISLTVVGFLFYTVLVVTGASSYDCPFQTPLSAALRGILPVFSSSNLILVIHATQRNTRKLLQNLSKPNATSLMYAAWMDARQGLISIPRSFHEIMSSPFSLNISPSRIVPGVRSQARSLGRHVAILPPLIYQTFGNVRQRLVQRLRRFRCTTILPVAAGDVPVVQPLVPQNGTRPGLRLRVLNFEALRRQNADNARCVCWVLRNFTDPEAIDSAIRLAGNIRWFDPSSEHDPPFDLIVSIFEACFDSTKVVYPGMRDRAYFSARAILQIHVGARVQSDDYALNYPIPTVFTNSARSTDPDLFDVLYTLERNSGNDRPTLYFPVVTPHTYAHLTWMSNLFLDLTRVGPNPILESYSSYCDLAASGNRAAIANTLLMWCMLLGGNIEEETFWATDKSDSLEPILSLLASRVANVIADGRSLDCLDCLLEFLAAWDERPISLTPMVYQWCATLFEVAGRAYGTMGIELSVWLRLESGPQGRFAEVGPYYDSFRSDDTPRHMSGSDPVRTVCIDILFRTLAIGSRRVDPDLGRVAVHLNHASQSGRMFETVLSSDDDETVADAVCLWIVDSDSIPPGLFARYIVGRVERTKPLPPRLRRMCIRAIERIGKDELKVSGPEAVRLLNCLNADVGDIVHPYEWAGVLISAIRSPAGMESLSSHCWCVLGKLVKLATKSLERFESRDGEVMRSLKEAGDWEKLEVWMGVIWRDDQTSEQMEDSEPMKAVKRVTLELLLRRPSALPMFQDMYKGYKFVKWHYESLQWICLKARMKPLPLECPSRPPSICANVPLHFAGDDTF